MSEKMKCEQSLAEDAEELLGGSDSDDSASKEKLAHLQGTPCDKPRCACFLCRQCILVDKDQLRWFMRQKENEIKKLKTEIKKLQAKK